MIRKDINNTLAALAEPLAASLGLCLWGIDVSFGTRGVVRIFVEDARLAAAPDSALPGALAVDSPAADDERPDPALEARVHGVSIDQCASLSRMLGLSLDVEDIMPGAYVLEISSPGLDRRFFTAGQLAGAKGRLVDVSLTDAPEGWPERLRFQGRLESAALADDGGAFGLRLDESDGGGLVPFHFSDVKKARQMYLPPEKTKPGKGSKPGAAPKAAQESGRKPGKGAAKKSVNEKVAPHRDGDAE
ncbi:MAG: ribosome maturation factor RimP [Desulfovibrio sp.]|jgi:ribosome maturation factor RimP|nr:ribosome maturation factor RimP [Desulfovibrio sp.]